VELVELWTEKGIV